MYYAHTQKTNTQTIEKGIEVFVVLFQFFHIWTNFIIKGKKVKTNIYPQV